MVKVSKHLETETNKMVNQSILSAGRQVLIHAGNSRKVLGEVSASACTSPLYQDFEHCLKFCREFVL